MSKKQKYKSINYLPTAYSFSNVYTDTTNTDEEGERFDVGDNNSEVDKIFNQLALEQMIIDIMYNLNDREKVIFMYQLLRDDGYNITHENCAKTLYINRQWYMNSLSRIRKKVSLFIKKRKGQSTTL